MDNNRKVVELPLDDVLPNRFQPRIKFNEEAITELSESIKEHGVIQPIVVRPVGDRYEIIAGERRFKASTLAGLSTIPAIIINLNDKDSAEVALIENVQRQDLTPIEEAISYKKILDMGYLKQEDLAEKIGKSQSAIANKLRLLNLDEDVQEALLNGKISERHARSLLKLTNKEDQVKLLNKIITERLTVRKTDEEINKMLNGENKEVNKDIEVLNLDEPVIIPSFEADNKFNIPSNPIIENETSSQERKAQDIINPFLNVDLSSETTTKENEDNLPKFNDLIKNTDEIQEHTENKEKEVSNFFNIPTSEEIDNMLASPEKVSEKTDNYQFKNDFVPQNESTSTPDFTISPNFGIPTFDDSIFNNPSSNSNSVKNELPEVKRTDTFVTGDIKTVINTLRDCANTIEKYGFDVDTEEFDLGDMYQVVFKVHKKPNE